MSRYIRFDKEKICRLENYLTVPEAAEKLNTTKARVHQMIEEGRFNADDLRRVGGGSQAPIIIHEDCLINIDLKRRSYEKDGKHSKYIPANSKSYSTETVPTYVQSRNSAGRNIVSDYIIYNLMFILSSRFKNGYRINSNIDFDRLCAYYLDEHGVELNLDSNDVNYIIASNALVFDDRAYHFSQETVTSVLAMLSQEKTPCVFIDYFFTKYANELYSIGIFSIEMLHSFIPKYFSSSSLERGYILLHDDASPSDIVKDLFIEREEWSLNDLCDRLPFISKDTIQQVLNGSEYLHTKKGIYTHINNLYLPENEGDKIIDFVDASLQHSDHVVVSELDLSVFMELNPNCAIPIIRESVFNKFLSDNYEKIGQIIIKRAK